MFYDIYYAIQTYGFWGVICNMSSEEWNAVIGIVFIILIGLTLIGCIWDRCTYQ